MITSNPFQYFPPAYATLSIFSRACKTLHLYISPYGLNLDFHKDTPRSEPFSPGEVPTRLHRSIQPPSPSSSRFPTSYFSSPLFSLSPPILYFSYFSLPYLSSQPPASPPLPEPSEQSAAGQSLRNGPSPKTIQTKTCKYFESEKTRRERHLS